MRFVFLILAIFAMIVGLGWWAGYLALGFAAAFIAFGWWGIWMAMNSPLQLQPIPLISVIIGIVILVFQIGVMSN